MQSIVLIYTIAAVLFFSWETHAQRPQERAVVLNGYTSINLPAGITAFQNENTIAAWLYMTKNKGSDDPVIFESTSAESSIIGQQHGFEVYWSTTQQRLNLRVYGSGFNTGDLATIDLEDGDMHFIALAIGSNHVVCYVDGIIEFNFTVSLLPLWTPTTTLQVGCGLSGQRCMIGGITQFMAWSKQITPSIARYRSSYAVGGLDPTNVMNGFLGTSVAQAPDQFVGPFPATTIRCWNGGMVSMATRFPARFPRRTPIFTFPNDGKCATRSPDGDFIATLTFPTMERFRHINGYGIELNWEQKQPVLVSVYGNNGEFLGNTTKDSIVVDYTEPSTTLTLKVKVSETFDITCMNLTILTYNLPMIRFHIGRTLYSNITTRLEVLSGIRPGDGVIFVPLAPGAQPWQFTTQNCIDMKWQRPMSYATEAKQEGGAVTVEIKGLAASTYLACVYPQHLQNFPRVSWERIEVHAIPSGNLPLGTGWVQYLLHYGRDFTTHIENTPSNALYVDYFQSVGGEAGYQPYIGASLGDPNSELIWTPLAQTDGFWGHFQDSYLYDNFVDYYALAVFSPYDQDLQLLLRHDDGLRVYADGNKVYEKNSWDGTAVQYASPFLLKTGWHQFLFKLQEVGGDSYLAIKFTAKGLSFDYELPESVTNKDYHHEDKHHPHCDQIDKNALCGPKGISADECNARGCCYSTNSTGGKDCFKPIEAARTKYRFDGMCGPGFPTADSDVAQCNPGSATGAGCCSQWHWCGNETQWCFCDGCIDYRANLRRTYNFTCNDCSCGIAHRYKQVGFYECTAKCDRTTECTGILFNASMCTLVLGSCTPDRDVSSSAALYRRAIGSCKMVQIDCPDCVPNCMNPASVITSVNVDDCHTMCKHTHGCRIAQYVNASVPYCQLYLENQYYHSCINNKPYFTHKTTGARTFTYFYQCGTDVVPTVDGTGHDSAVVVQNRKEYSYVGCFNDNARIGRPTISPIYSSLYTADSSRMTSDFCYEFCLKQGGLYFGLQNGRECYCGASYGTSRSPTCATPCSGNQSEVCGGTGTNSVYRIELTNNGCPTNYLQYGGRCFYVNSQSLTKSQAQAACATVPGGHLATVPDAKTKFFIQSFVGYRSLPAPSSATVFLGATDEGHEGTWVWEDGTPFSYTSWNAGEPNNSGGSENCLEMDYHPMSGTRMSGSWNDNTCGVMIGSVCEAPLASTESKEAKIDFVEASPSLVCVHSESILNNMTRKRYLAADYTFDDPQNNLIDYSGRDHSGKYSQPSKSFGVIGYALNLNDPATRMAGISTGNWNISTNTLSISAWIYVSHGTSGAIVSKLFSVVTQTNFWNHFQRFLYVYQLSVTNGILYFTMSGTTITAQLPLDQYVHVAAVYDNSKLVIYVNGELMISRAYNDPIQSSSNPVLIGVGVYGALQSPLLVDELKIYEEALSESDVREIYMCTAKSDPTLYVYYQRPISVRLHGGGLAQGLKAQLRVRCDNEVLTNEGAFLPMDLTSFFGSIAATINLLPQHTSFESKPLSLCLNVIGTDKFSVDTGVRVVAVDIHGLSRSNFSLSEMPINVTVSGVNLRDGMSIGVSSASDCLHVTESFPIIAGRIQLDVLHHSSGMFLCWRPQGGQSNFIPTHHSITVTDSEWILLANVHKSDQVTPTDLCTGTGPVTTSADRYRDWGSEFVVKVVMGSFIDYYVPANHWCTPCSFLSSAYMDYSWSSKDPASPKFDGKLLHVTKEYDGSQRMGLGGSPEGWSRMIDGRPFLSFWGTQGSDLGGCCASNLADKENPSWGQPFMLFIHKMQPSSRIEFLDLPTVVYAGTTVHLHLVVADELGLTYNRNYLSVVLGLQDGTLTTFTNLTVDQNGVFTLAFKTPSSTKSYTTLNVTCLSPCTAPKFSLNSPLLVVAAPEGATVLTSGGNVTTLLHLGSNSDDSIPCSGACLSTDYLASSGGEGAARPAAGMTATPMGMTEPLTWTQLQTQDGVFREDGQGHNAVHYYAFALYSAIGQTVSVRISGETHIWADGTEIKVNGGVTISWRRGDPTVYLAEGWHQILIKRELKKDAKQDEMSVGFIGAGLLIKVQMPPLLPPDASPIDNNVWITQLLHLGSKFEDAFSGENSHDYINGEADARPRAGEIVSGLTWTPMTSPTGWWANTDKVNGKSFEHFVQYMALAVYSPSVQLVTVTFRYDDHLTVWVDGDMKIKYMYSDHGQPQVTHIMLSEGWHQFLFKIAEETELNYFRVMFGTADAPANLAWQYEIPDESALAFLAPTGFVARLLHLGSNPRDSIITNNASLEFIDINKEYRPGMVDKDLTWTPLNTPNGMWADHPTGGDATHYFSLAVYSPIPQVITAHVRHNQEVAVWVDGTPVLRRNGWDANRERVSSPFELSLGWHQFIFKLHSVDDFEWMGLLPNTSFDPCESSGRKMCDVEAYCLNGAPRSDHPIPHNSPTTIMLPGLTRMMDMTCSQIDKTDHIQSATAACCRSPDKASIFAIRFQGGILQYAYSVPPHAIDPPIIANQYTVWMSTYVELNSSNPDASIYYTLDGSDPNPESNTTEKYDGYSVNIYSDKMTVLLRAIAVYKQKHSEIVSWTIDIPHEVFVGRRSWIANAETVLSFWGGTSVVAGVLITNVTNPYLSYGEALMYKANESFTGVLTLNNQGAAIVPKLDVGDYYVYYYELTALTNTSDVPKMLWGIVSVLPMNVSKRHIFVNEQTIVPLCAGTNTDDAIQWFNVSTDYCTDDFCRSASPSDYNVIHSNAMWENSVTVSYPQPTDLPCLCFTTSTDPVNLVLVATAFVGFPMVVVDGQVPATVMPTQPAPTILKLSTSFIVTTEMLTITGINFDPTATINNNVFFLPSAVESGVGNAPPTCYVTNVSLTTIVCRVMADAGVSGRWDIIVRVNTANSNIFPQQILIQPPGPVVTSVEGNCANNVPEAIYRCESDGILIVRGTNFDTVTPSNNHIEFSRKSLPKPTDIHDPQCVVKSVTTQSITCALTFEPDVTGEFRVHLVIHLDSDVDHYLQSKWTTTHTISIGGQTLNAAGEGGNNQQGPVPPPPAGGKTLAIISFSVLGVLVVGGLIAYFVVKRRYNVVLYRRSSLDDHGIELTDAEEIDLDAGNSSEGPK